MFTVTVPFKVTVPGAIGAIVVLAKLFRLSVVAEPNFPGFSQKANKTVIV